MGKYRDAYVAIDSLTNQLQNNFSRKVLHEYLCKVLEIVKETEDKEKDNRYEKGFEYGYSLIKNDIAFWMQLDFELDDPDYEPELFVETILASRKMSCINLEKPEDESRTYSQAFKIISSTVMEYVIRNGRARNEDKDAELLADIWVFLAEVDQALEKYPEAVVGLWGGGVDDVNWIVKTYMGKGQRMEPGYYIDQIIKVIEEVDDITFEKYGFIHREIWKA